MSVRLTGKAADRIPCGGNPCLQRRECCKLVDEYSVPEILAGACRITAFVLLEAGPLARAVQGVILIPAEPRSAGQVPYSKDRIIDGQGLTPDVQVLTPGLHIAAARCYLERRKRLNSILNLILRKLLLTEIPLRSPGDPALAKFTCPCVLYWSPAAGAWTGSTATGASRSAAPVWT